MKDKACNEEFLKARENPFKGIQSKGKSTQLFLPNKLFLTSRRIYTHPTPKSLPPTSRKNKTTKCLKEEYLLLNNIINSCKNQPPGAYYTTEIVQKSLLSYQNSFKRVPGITLATNVSKVGSNMKLPPSKCI